MLPNGRTEKVQNQVPEINCDLHQNDNAFNLLILFTACFQLFLLQFLPFSSSIFAYSAIGFGIGIEIRNNDLLSKVDSTLSQCTAFECLQNIIGILYRNLTVTQWAPDDITATKQHAKLDGIFIYGFCYLQLMFIFLFACRPFSFGQIIKFYALPFM